MHSLRLTRRVLRTLVARCCWQGVEADLLFLRAPGVSRPKRLRFDLRPQNYSGEVGQARRISLASARRA
jgi:hypothetical protein